MLKEKARVIITFDCERGCEYCCNEQPGMLEQATVIDSIDKLKDFEEIMLTGGESLLDPQRTLDLIKQIRANEQ